MDKFYLQQAIDDLKASVVEYERMTPEQQDRIDTGLRHAVKGFPTRLAPGNMIGLILEQFERASTRTVELTKEEVEVITDGLKSRKYEGWGGMSFATDLLAKIGSTERL